MYTAATVLGGCEEVAEDYGEHEDELDGAHLQSIPLPSGSGRVVRSTVTVRSLLIAREVRSNGEGETP